MSSPKIMGLCERITKQGDRCDLGARYRAITGELICGRHRRYEQLRRENVINRRTEEHRLAAFRAELAEINKATGLDLRAAGRGIVLLEFAKLKQFINNKDKDTD